MIFMVIIAMVLILPLSAQTYKAEPFDGQSSNVSKATSGLFGSEVDDYMDVNYYSGVEFSKWFGFITGGMYTPVNATNPKFAIDLGYATKLGTLYLGTRYAGNVVQFTGTASKQIRVTYPPTTAGFNPTETRTDTYWTQGWIESTNQIEALIGVAGMGIKVGFFESLATNEHKGPQTQAVPFYKTVNHQTGETNIYNESVDYSRIIGLMKPSLLWGMNLKMGGMSINPYVGAGFGIFQDKSVDIRKDTYTVASGGATTSGTETKRYGGTAAGSLNYDNGYLTPDITAGATVDIPKEKFDISIGVDYNLSFDIYSKNYEAPGVSGTANGTVSFANNNTNRSVDKYLDRTETVENAVVSITEKTAWNHAISPSFKITKDISGVKLGFRAGLPVKIDLTTDSDYSDTYYTEKISYYSAADKYSNETTTNRFHTAGNLVETTTFNIAPELGIGASYELVAKRFTVNAGINATLLDYTNTTTKTSSNGDDKDYYKTVDGYGKTTVNYVDGPIGAVTKTNTVSVRDTWLQYSSTVTAGFVFNFNENFAADLQASVGTTRVTVDLTNVNILFTFKF